MRSRLVVAALTSAAMLGTACAARSPAVTSTSGTTTTAASAPTTTTTTSAPASTSTTGAVPAGAAATVERVVDGDTIVLAGGERVRLIGVDTPETKDPRKPVQCFGEAASAHTSALLPPGTAVRLEHDVEPRDRYGRTLAYVYRASDGLLVNADLVASGFAQILTIPPNVAHVDEFRALQTEAREAGRGLWSAC